MSLWTFSSTERVREVSSCSSSSRVTKEILKNHMREKHRCFHPAEVCLQENVCSTPSAGGAVGSLMVEIHRDLVDQSLLKVKSCLTWTLPGRYAACEETPAASRLFSELPEGNRKGLVFIKKLSLKNGKWKMTNKPNPS